MAARDWTLRLAGGLVVVLGLLNIVFGVVSLTTELVRLTTGVASGLVVVGAVTTAAGVLVWRGSRLATNVMLTLFGLLLVSQLGGALTAPPTATALDPADDPTLRLAVLAVVVAALALAAVRMRRRRVGR